MQKSFSKRITITKNGKIVRRSMRLDHFKIRKSTANNRNKRRGRSLDYPLSKIY